MRIDTLFERCLIACALYEEYWLMYAQHLEDRMVKEPEQRSATERLLRSVYRRACTVHVYDKTTLYLMWSNFEEKSGTLLYALSLFEPSFYVASFFFFRTHAQSRFDFRPVGEGGAQV